ncbi:MAG TPA: rhodanese-like domain-containing protein [Archangium sp.]|nr:rhodanese-like domain-containing protein [Archangium sp.]
MVVYCQAGGRSAIAAQILRAHGFTDIFDLKSVNNW